MPSYKLTYFNGKGRAELARLLFAEAEVKFEDIRIESAEWADLKSKSPFGQLPMLEVDGEVFCQSLTISRYLAREFNMVGKTQLEAMKTDMVLDCISDMITGVVKLFSAKDEEKAEITKKLKEEQAPTNLANLEKMVDESGYFVSSGLTWADLAFYQFLDFPKIFGIEFDLSKFPKLNGILSKVEARPNIATWIKSRPETSF